MILTCDAETYYSKEYSLSVMTTESYIRDPQFECMGWSVKVDDSPAQWFTGDKYQTGEWLKQFPWESSAACAHNAMFDMAILNWHFGIRPKLILDTLSMARALDGLLTPLSLAKLAEFYNLASRKGHEVKQMVGVHRLDMTPQVALDYGRYCVNDADMTYEMMLKLLPRMPKSMLQLQDWTIRAFTEPKLLLDRHVIENELREFRIRQSTLLRDIGINDPGVLRSDDKFSELLIDLGVEPPMKLSPNQMDLVGNPKWVFAFAKTDLEFTDLREHEDERVVAMVEARLGHKTSAVGTRLERFHGISKRGPLPVPLAFAGAMVTKRWAGTDKINLQNLPRNPKGGLSPLRQAICAPPGKRMAVTDLSQIELRVNCWQAGQTDTLDLLRAGGDVYSAMATDIFGVPVDRKRKVIDAAGVETYPDFAMGFVGKTTELGCGYQCGHERFWQMLKVDSRKFNIVLPDASADFAERVVKTYRFNKKAIVRNWYKAKEVIPIIATGGTAMLGPYAIFAGRVLLPDSTYLYYPNMRFEEFKGQMQWVYDRYRGRGKIVTRMFGGKLVENITQAVASKFMSDAMLRIMTIKDNAGRMVFDIVGTVHDELIVLFDENLDDAWVKDALKWAMTTPPPWAADIPLGCDTGIGYNYASCK